MKAATSRSKFSLYAAASAAAIGTANIAQAQFVGDYTVGTDGSYNGAGTYGNWTGAAFDSFLNESLTLSSTQVDLGYSGYVSNPGGSYTFTAPAAAASTVSFDYSASASGDGYTGYLVNGAFNSFSGASGTVNYAIGVGEIFGFKIGANYNTGGFGSGGASLTITNFSVTAVPEPGTTTLLAGCAALGFVGLLARRERRRRATLAAV